MRDHFVKNEIDATVIEGFFRALARFGARHDVTAVDVGYKLTNGEIDASAGPAIRVHVREKVDKPSHVPAAQRIPRRIEGVPTDVIQAIYVNHTGTCPTLPDRIRRSDTIQPGISIGHEDGTAGTLGLIVRDAGGGDPNARYILSCDHVLEESQDPRVGDAVLQPGPADGGRAGPDTIAKLDRFNRRMDAAIARISGERRLDSAQFETGVVLAGPEYPRLGSILEKSGKGSCVTHAIVDGIGIYPGIGPGLRLRPIVDDGSYGAISDFGDSGAIWYEPDTGLAIGMHARGSDFQNEVEQFAIASCLPDVFERLQITLA
jgi:hypothetical protein